MECKYVFNNKEYSYLELSEELKEDASKLHDILYSRDDDTLLKIYDKLSEIKKKGKEEYEGRKVTHITDDGSEIEKGGADYTLQSFIDSNKYNDTQGNPIMPVLNDELFLDKMKSKYAEQGLSLEEINQRIYNILKSWKQIGNDGKEFHRIILGDNRTYSQTEKLTKGTTFEPLAEKILREISDDVLKLVYIKNGKESHEIGDSSSPYVIKNLNVTAKLGDSNETIVGHIDYLVIKPDGSLEIYNIKTSHEAPSFWDRAKKEKYRHEFALLGQILLYNGISSKNIRFNVVPVVFDYNSDFSGINDIKVHPSECYSHKNGAFIMHEEMKQAQRFIGSSVNEIKINDESIDKINKQLKTAFPGKDVLADGVTQTIEEYIDKNWKYWEVGELPDTGYSLTINGIKFLTEDSTRGSKNKDVYNFVESMKDDLLKSDIGSLSAQGIITELKSARRNGFPSFNNSYLNEFFYPYFEKSKVIKNDETGKEKFIYEWEIVDNPTLNNCNILLFKNKSGQLNIVSLSSLNLSKTTLLNGRKNILGFHLTDMNAQDSQGRALLKATYGNIEMMRTMFVLNEIIPSLGNDVKLGEIQVVGGLGTDVTSQSYPIQMVVPNFVKAYSIISKKEPQLKMENHFKEIENVSPVTVLINEYYNIMQNNPDLSKSDLNLLKELISGSDSDGMRHDISGILSDSLASAETTEIQISRLEELIDKLSKILNEKAIRLSPDILIEKSKSRDPMISSAAKLLIDASIALDRLSGIVRIEEKDVEEFERLFARPLNMDNSHVRVVSKLLLDGIHNISTRLDGEVSDFNLKCLKYYEKKGYSKFLNWAVGNQSSVFENLIEFKDNDLFFKNPFDMTNNLKTEEREFLKEVLYLINSKRIQNVTRDNLKTILSTEENALWVPLELASESTKWSNPSAFFEDLGRKTKYYTTHPTELFKELYEGIMTLEEEEQVNKYIENMLMYNKFKSSETKKGRARLISKFGVNLFETNIQNLVIDYLYHDLKEEEFNKALVRSRGILLYLKLTGIREEGNPLKFAKTIKHIDDYLKTSVFNRSIMEESSKLIITKIAPLRKAISTAYIAMNPVAAIRDTIGGFMSNVVRSATKFRTDVDSTDVLWAYLYLLTHGVHSSMSIDLLDKMNSKYLISNINREQLQQGYKTNKGGITNVSNWMYLSLSKPDYLNRMTLFLAKLKHDGSFEAYDIKDGKLNYNWRKDKRFSLLAKNDKSNIEEYNKLKSLYLSLLQEFNKQNPELNLTLKLDTDLPDGYTLNQIESVKHLGDTIYGSYDKSTKAMYENLAVGSLIGVFSTWLNGIYDVYFGSRRESSYEFEKVLKEDENGNKLWIDENGNITTEDTGIPYLEDIPLMVQGVMRTVKDVFGELYEGRGIQGIKENILSSKTNRANLRRLLSDFLVAMLLYELCSNVLAPAYKKHKQEGDGKNVVANAMTELMYKGFTSSFEEFKGPLPIFDYVMNNTSPAAVKWGFKTYKDLAGYIFGDTTTGELITKSLALPRSLQDTYRMYKRDTKNGTGGGGGAGTLF